MLCPEKWISFYVNFIENWIEFSTCPWTLQLTRRACRTPDKQKTSMFGPKVDSNALSLDWKENFFFSWFYFQIINSTNIHWCKEVSDSELDAGCTKPNSIWFLLPSVLQSPRGGRPIHSIHSYCLSTYSILATILGACDATVEHIYKDTCPEGVYILLGVVLGKTADLQPGKYISKWWIFWFKPKICLCQRVLEAGMAGLCHNFPSL